MLGRQPQRDAQFLDALEDVKHWARRQFGLPGIATVAVTEVVCTQPDCAPLETVVVFWDAHGKRHQFKVFKPVMQIGHGDIGQFRIGPAGEHLSGLWECC